MGCVAYEHAGFTSQPGVRVQAASRSASYSNHEVQRLFWRGENEFSDECPSQTGTHGAQATSGGFDGPDHSLLRPPRH